MNAKQWSCALAMLGVFSPAGRSARPDRGAAQPNIVVILADDLGFADVGVHGCKDVPTPHIDSIAANGVRFSNGYATHSVCAPSRAGLISGMYQYRFGFEHNPGPEEYASPKFGVPRGVPTLAEKLQAAGYATGMVGKWHVGFRKGLRPHERGYDFSFDFLGGARPYFSRAGRDELYRDGKRVKRENQYLTNAFARESIAFIEQHKDEPFFLYLAFNAVHTPMQPPNGYRERFPEIQDPKRRELAGMHAAMDDAIGRVLETLRRNDLEENTLVFFYSDNGGIPAKNASRNDPLRGVKGQLFEGGVRVPFMVQWKGKLPAGAVYEKPVMGFDVHATALAAAGVSEQEGAAIDGKNLIPYLTGELDGQPHERLFWRDGMEHAVRAGDWKLVVRPPEPPMLFNLEHDVGERMDLASEEPEKLDELRTAFAAWNAEMMDAQWDRQDSENAERGGELKTKKASSPRQSD